MRSFKDDGGTEWRVWSIVPQENAGPDDRSLRHLPDVMREGWLCFESDAEKRRLAPPPRDWEARSDDELAAMCSSALPVRRARAVPGEAVRVG